MVSPSYKVVSYLDQRGWCLDRHTDDLSKYAKTLKYIKVIRDEEIPPADLTLIWNWPYLSKLERQSKVTTFLLDHWSIDFYQKKGLDFFDLIHQKADYLIVINEELWRRVIPFMKIPVFKLSYGIDSTYFNPKPLPKNLIFGWCGNSNASPTQDDFKGFQTLRKVCQKLDVPFIELSHEGRVGLYEVVEHYYSKVAVHICFSVSEGDNNPLREALCCGRPVITTPVGTVANLVSHNLNGLIINRDSIELANSIRYFVENPNEVRRMSQNCSILSKTESWNSKAPLWETAFKMMIENK
tara:strand:+ start:7092 stop:7982 length:891 start_codon:yes stop_codon:yes gene_type:complete